ncbi:hypothetical protein TNCV_3049331 [Trichonephila clavipes]|nr:hypothetical protein TNCV_3049331 [Trichonephila clavipes]
MSRNRFSGLMNQGSISTSRMIVSGFGISLENASCLDALGLRRTTSLVMLRGPPWNGMMIMDHQLDQLAESLYLNLIGNL